MATISLTRLGHIREAAFETGPTAQVVVDLAGQVALINEQARALFRLNAASIWAARSTTWSCLTSPPSCAP